METNSKLGGLLPSVTALNASLNQRLGTSQEPTMLTPSEQELLRQVEKEVDAKDANPSKWRLEVLSALREALKERIRLREEEIEAKLRLQVQLVQQVQIENHRMQLLAELRDTKLREEENNSHHTMQAEEMAGKKEAF